MIDSKTSLTLLDQVRRNHSEGWNRLFRIYGELVYQWCRKKKLARDDAADIVQDVFESVAKRIDKFHKSENSGTFRGWLRVITRHKIIDYFRRSDRCECAVGGSEMQNLVSQLPDVIEAGDERREIQIVVRRIFDLIRVDFDDNTVQAFERMVLGNFTASETADKLGMTPGAVRNAKYKVMKRLKEELAGLETLS